jgi:hypothetical protein
LIDALAADRPTYLLGAGGAHRPLGLVKTQAGRIEREAEMVEQATHLTLGILYEGFVDHAVDPTRCDLVEMAHKADIVAIIGPDILQPVAEPLAAREMLLEVGEAAGERMPPRVDDSCVRQDQPDEADMGPVVGHLVDKEGPVGLALDPRPLEIFLAEPAQVVGAELGQAGRIGGIVGPALWSS